MHRLFRASLAIQIAFSISALGAEAGEIGDRRADDGEASLPADARSAEKDYLAAAGETLLSDAFVFSVDRFVGNTDFSRISLESARRNLRARWQWDQSQFATNQVMHPLHGYSYFAAGRSNGLGFYESGLLASGGSALWELFCERCEPAMNDLIETTLGGATFGEMFHRLYIEAAGSGGSLSFLASPVDALSDAMSRRPAARPSGAIKAMSVSSRLGCVGYRRYQDGAECPADRAGTASAGFGFGCVYGDPFSQSGWIPFGHFELRMDCAGGYEWYDLTILSDGFLAAFPLEDSPAHQAAAGLTLHYDVLWTRGIQFSANSLDLTIKRRSIVSPELSLEQRIHAGALLLGVANFYPSDAEGRTSSREAMHGYGSGADLKASLSFVDPRAGSALCLGARLYGMRILPGTVEDSEGAVLCRRYSLELSLPVGERLSIRLSDACIQEDGWYRSVPDVRKVEYEAAAGVVLSLR